MDSNGSDKPAKNTKFQSEHRSTSGIVWGLNQAWGAIAPPAHAIGFLRKLAESLLRDIPPSASPACRRIARWPLFLTRPPDPKCPWLSLAGLVALEPPLLGTLPLGESSFARLIPQASISVE